MGTNKIRFIRINPHFEKNVWDMDEIASVAENDHDFYKDEKGQIILISCVGDQFIVKNMGKKSLRTISNTFERRTE